MHIELARSKTDSQIIYQPDAPILLASVIHSCPSLRLLGTVAGAYTAAAPVTNSTPTALSFLDCAKDPSAKKVDSLLANQCGGTCATVDPFVIEAYMSCCVYILG